jgi:hypothetical protein
LWKKNIPVCFNMQTYGSVRKNDTNMNDATGSLTFLWYLPVPIWDENSWFLKSLSA